jgi:hypothetical protein
MKGALAAAFALVLAAGVFTVQTSSNSPHVPEREKGRPIRVEVLNGSGIRGAGLELAEALRENGFDVVGIRNADRSDHERTIVVSHGGVPGFAQAVAASIGPVILSEEPSTGSFLEVTVILGRDHAIRSERR